MTVHKFKDIHNKTECNKSYPQHLSFTHYRSFFILCFNMLKIRLLNIKTLQCLGQHIKCKIIDLSNNLRAIN